MLSDEEERIFESGSDFENILSNKIDELKIQVKNLQQEKEELDKIKKFQEYDKEIIKDYDFDIRLIQYSDIENLKQSVWIINNKEIKISQLLSESSQLKSEVDIIKQKITIPQDTQNLTGLIKEYEIRKEITNKRKRKILDRRNLESIELAGLNAEMPHLQKNLKEKQDERSDVFKLYDSKKGSIVKMIASQPFRLIRIRSELSGKDLFFIK
ncbi:MAG: hypothetical protein Q8862_01270 [Bacteroidota bacterium]|nr:hypothetical protein [Bacteroidota bacterium]